MKATRRRTRPEERGGEERIAGSSKVAAKEKPKRRAGRRSLLTPELQKEIVKSLQAGVYQETAAHAGGIEVSTYFSWLSRGRSEKERRESGGSPDRRETPFVEFVKAVGKARAMAVTRAVASILKAGLDGDWRALAWWLERSYPNQWGRKNTLEVGGNPEAPIRHEHLHASLPGAAPALPMSEDELQVAFQAAVLRNAERHARKHE